VLVDTSGDHAEEARKPGESTVLVAHSVKLFRSPLFRGDDRTE
jgi:hypothetical protein